MKLSFEVDVKNGKLEITGDIDLLTTAIQAVQEYKDEKFKQMLEDVENIYPPPPEYFDETEYTPEEMYKKLKAGWPLEETATEEKLTEEEALDLLSKIHKLLSAYKDNSLFSEQEIAEVIDEVMKEKETIENSLK